MPPCCPIGWQGRIFRRRNYVPAVGIRLTPSSRPVRSRSGPEPYLSCRTPRDEATRGHMMDVAATMADVARGAHRHAGLPGQPSPFNWPGAGTAIDWPGPAGAQPWGGSLAQGK